MFLAGFQRIKKRFGLPLRAFHVSIGLDFSVRRNILLICYFFNLLLGQAGQPMAGNTNCIFSMEGIKENSSFWELNKYGSWSSRSDHKWKSVASGQKTLNNKEINSDVSEATENIFSIGCQIGNGIKTCFVAASRKISSSNDPFSWKNMFLICCFF